MTRSDLLALSSEALASLANRGLVKRATKDLDAGTFPQITVEDDGTVVGVFPDGAHAALPVGVGLDTATCGCSSTSVCRHRVGLVLAYQREMAAGAAATETAGTAAQVSDAADDTANAVDPAFTVWSPGTIDDDALNEFLGKRAMTSARRLRRAGFSARVCRPAASDPIARVELPSCTVRFLVPNELSYAHSDAAKANQGEFVALAVWAFREADQRGLTGDDVRLDVGGARQDTDSSGIEPALVLVDRLLNEGAMHTGEAFLAELHRTAAALEAADLRWPAGAVTELAAQLTAYTDRAATHRSRRVAELITELHARHQASINPSASPRSRVLGTDEPANTPLRRVRLTSLGARIEGSTDENTHHRTVNVYLAELETRTVMVLRREFTVTGEPPTPNNLANRRVNGVSLRSLAAAEIVSESASRNASRLMRISDSRVAKTTVLPLGASWTSLPEPLLVRDFAATAEAMRRRPPSLIRPRVEAENIHVVRAAEVLGVGYHPGEQRLSALIADDAGNTMTVSAHYRSTSPGSLDALAEALRGAEDDDPVRLISGALTRVQGGLVLDPIAVLTGSTVVVPDLADGAGAASFGWGAEAELGPLDTALNTALLVLGDTAHRGFAHLSPSLLRRVSEAAAGLQRVGLRTGASLVAAFETALGAQDPARRAQAWVAATLQLLVTAEAR
ncbi:hypothetical protein [Actinoalloteichus hymeniacidonis]|uniref:SWIM-type domain-containing protein n=1 Tax=Actinoalloteichus hymeniacidonis TaxID=340345 RepID=A0AAC9HRR8_9PSEU|nr:hypothetical protein [Actinoalloteichus hymeniacidonis]AOS64163.1 hypothetical protein TL08_16815 [Actinoalloteichus hymeniacidonis]MBB5907770.1 hypothetical protein [Actinoalloteichus hymeniacidonis]